MMIADTHLLDCAADIAYNIKLSKLVYLRTLRALLIIVAFYPRSQVTSGGDFN